MFNSDEPFSIGAQRERAHDVADRIYQIGAFGGAIYSLLSGIGSRDLLPSAYMASLNQAEELARALGDLTDRAADLATQVAYTVPDDEGADAATSTPHVSGQETGRDTHSDAEARAQTDDVHRLYARYLSTRAVHEALPDGDERAARVEAAYLASIDAFLAAELTTVDHLLFAIGVMSGCGEHGIDTEHARRLQGLAVTLRTERINHSLGIPVAGYVARRQSDGFNPAEAQADALKFSDRYAVALTAHVETDAYFGKLSALGVEGDMPHLHEAANAANGAAFSAFEKADPQTWGDFFALILRMAQPSAGASIDEPSCRRLIDFLASQGITSATTFAAARQAAGLEKAA